jgi:hypothetical protein
MAISCRKDRQTRLECRLNYLILSATFLALLLGCSKATQYSTSSGDATVAESAAISGPIYPHSEEFKKTFLHGRTYLADKLLCAKCHGADNKGGSTKVSCNDCHAAYPHPADWPLPAKHGATFAAADDDARKWCLTCHIGPTADNPAAKCATCHAAFPHSDDFISGGDNHPTLARTYEGKCAACHTDLSRNMPNLGSCRACHQEGNPEMHWVTPPPPAGTGTSTSTSSSLNTATARRIASPAKKRPKH